MRLTRAPQKPLCQMAMGNRTALIGGSKETLAGAKKAPSLPSLHATIPSPVRMLCSGNGSCDVWQLGQHAPLRPGGAGGGGGGGAGHAIASRSKWQTQQRGEGHPLDLINSPRHLAQIKLGGGARVACSAISPDGSVVACCSGSGPIRLYRLVDDGNAEPGTTAMAGRAARHGGAPVKVERIKFPSGVDRAVALAISSAGHLVAAHPDGSVSCFELLLTPSASAVQPADDEDKDTAPPPLPCVRLIARSSSLEVSGPMQDRNWRLYHLPVASLTASPDGSTLVASGASGLILLRLPSLPSSTPAASEGPSSSTKAAKEAAVPPLQRLGGKVLRSQHDAPASGLSFSADGKLLAASLASGHLVVYDVEAARPTQVRGALRG